MSDVERNISASSSGQLNKRSCLRCSQRKVRCDKVHPCSICVKAGVQCTFPGPKRTRQTLNRPPVSELLTRLKHLEEEVEQLRSTRCHPDTDHTDLDDDPNLQKTVKKTELLVLKEGKSRYVSDEASVALGQKVGHGYYWYCIAVKTDLLCRSLNSVILLKALQMMSHIHSMQLITPLSS